MGESRSGYLASLTTEYESAGSISCPWKIVASKGMKINFTLYDFARAKRDHFDSEVNNLIGLHIISHWIPIFPFLHSIHVNYISFDQRKDEIWYAIGHGKKVFLDPNLPSVVNLAVESFLYIYFRCILVKCTHTHTPSAVALKCVSCHYHKSAAMKVFDTCCLDYTFLRFTPPSKMSVSTKSWTFAVKLNVLWPFIHHNRSLLK